MLYHKILKTTGVTFISSPYMFFTKMLLNTTTSFFCIYFSADIIDSLKRFPIFLTASYKVVSPLEILNVKLSIRCQLAGLIFSY